MSAPTKIPLKVAVQPLAYNQEQAAAALCVSVAHFERHIKADLPVVLTGCKRLYPRSGIESWIEENSLRGGRRVA